MSMAPQANVICMKWGLKYSRDYVNRLASMVARHLDRPHRFVCFTDDPEGLDGGIQAEPLPELRLPPGSPERGWQKLGIFEPGLAGLQGPTLFLDLDIVIVDRLDPFFDFPGEVCIIQDYKPLRIERYVGNSSVFRFEAGAWPGVIEHFRKCGDEVRRRFRNEQEYLSHYVHTRGKLTHWPRDWCPSFKRDCMWNGPLGLFLVPRIPTGARIIVFHGHPHPDEAMAGKSGSWKRAVRPTPWIAEHWR